MTHPVKKSASFSVILTMPRPSTNKQQLSLMDSALERIKMKDRLQMTDEEMNKLDFDTRWERHDRSYLALREMIACSQEGLSVKENYCSKTGYLLDCTIKSTKPYDIPKVIQGLDNAKLIKIYNCKSIPNEITTLPLVKTLELRDLSQLPTMPNVEFPAVKKLCVTEGRKIDISTCEEYNISQFSNVRIHLTGLEKLELRNMHRNSAKTLLLSLLSHDDTGFRNTLQALELNHCGMNDEDIYVIFSEILPYLPNLKEINIYQATKNDGDENFLAFAAMAVTAKIEELGAFPFQSLTKLIVPIRSHSQIHAAIQLATEMRRLVYIGYGGLGDDYALRCLLNLNMGGRFLIEPGMPPPNQVELPPKNDLPLALWPKVLERAYTKSKGISIPSDNYHGRSRPSHTSSGKDPNALYYLLRNGPLLHERDVAMKSAKAVGDPKKKRSTKNNKKGSGKSNKKKRSAKSKGGDRKRTKR